MHRIPHYLVFRTKHDSYVLDRELVLIRRGASRMMSVFARAHGKPVSIEDSRWDSFSLEYGFSSAERKNACSYSLVDGDETGHQLALLASL